MSILRGNSSVGRAQPCQGWGREFESRFPLQDSKARFQMMKPGFFVTDDVVSLMVLSGDSDRFTAQCIQSQHIVVSTEVFPALQRDGHVAVLHQEVVEIAQ